MLEQRHRHAPDLVPTADPRIPTRPAVLAARLAAAWMVMFAAVHVYWLLDGRIGLPRRESIFERPALVVIDALAVPLCLLGAALALSLTRPPERRPAPRTRLRLMALTAVVLVVHALPTVPTWAQLVVGADVSLTEDERFVTFLYEPVFLTGGVLCTLAFVGYRATGVRLRRSGGSDGHGEL